jgi:uncharacterized protein (TIGR03435 family)
VYYVCCVPVSDGECKTSVAHDLELRTGLKASYDLKLSWESGESLSRVLEEQLGLKLEAQKVPVQFITIVSAQKPTEN